MVQKDFPFIVLNGPKVDSPAARRIIRKQAMRDVGEARKKRGNYGRVNMRQVPIFDDGTSVPIRSVSSLDGGEDDWALPDLTHSTDPSESSASPDAFDHTDEKGRGGALTRKALPVAHLHQDGLPALTAINLFTQYETARAKFHIDLTELSILTNFNVGKSTIPILSADPTRLAALLGHQQWYV